MINRENGYQNGIQISRLDLDYPNPLSPPRAAAITFWDLEIGKSTNGTPTLDDVILAMCDYNPRKRWAAWKYQEASEINYPVPDLINKSKTSEEAVWVALGAGRSLFGGRMTCSASAEMSFSGV